MTKKLSNAAEIRKFVKENPEASNTEVIAALKKRRISVTSSEVSTNRKKVEAPTPKNSPASKKKKAVRRKKRTTAQSSPAMATLEDLLAAKSLLQKIGDAKRACELIAFVDEFTK